MTASAIGKDGPRADALDPPEEDQLPHLLAEARQHRADEEEDDSEREQGLAAVEVGELAVDRDGHGAREEEDRDDPGVQVCAVELGDDPRQHRTDDRLVEGGEEHPEHDRAEDLELGPPAQAE